MCIHITAVLQCNNQRRHINLLLIFIHVNVRSRKLERKNRYEAIISDPERSTKQIDKAIFNHFGSSIGTLHTQAPSKTKMLVNKTFKEASPYACRKSECLCQTAAENLHVRCSNYVNT